MPTFLFECHQLIAERIVVHVSLLVRERAIADEDGRLASSAARSHEMRPTVARAKLVALIEGSRIASAGLWPG